MSEKSNTPASSPDATTRRETRSRETTRRDKTDRARVRASTDAAIFRAVENDLDSFEPDAPWLARARLVMPRTKAAVTLRLDSDVLAWFRSAGPGYQTRIDAVLRAFVDAQRPDSR